MNQKVFILISIFLINFHSCFRTPRIFRCLYEDSIEHGYTCFLSVTYVNELESLETLEGEHLPGKTDADVRRLESSWQTIVTIPSIICEAFINTEEIDFERCSVTQIDENSFKGCKKLKYLNLESNQVNQIDVNSFTENPELEFIELSSNFLMDLPENVFNSQQKLQYLAMNVNILGNLSSNVFTPLRNLKTINLSINGFTALKAEWFETLENLENLYVHTNHIEELPEGIFSHMSKLREIVFHSNRLKVIHSNSFGYHPNLHFAWLQKNQIEAIDERFILNTSVSEINMDFNVCAHGIIIDESYSRINMRMQLRWCFEKYEQLMTGSLK